MIVSGAWKCLVHIRNMTARSKRMRVELFPPDSDTAPRHWVRHDQAFAMMLRPGSIEWGSRRCRRCLRAISWRFWRRQNLRPYGVRRGKSSSGHARGGWSHPGSRRM